MKYTQIEISIDANYEDILCAFLIKAGSPSVIVDDPSLVAPKEGCIDKREINSDLSGRIQVTATFDAEKTNAGITVKSFLSKLNTPYDIKITSLKKKDWNSEWKKHYKGIKIENLLNILPPWEDIIEKDVPNVIINPAEGFGTGSHVTTHMCLSALKGINLEGKRVLDAGCGSAILGISAKILGALEVVMIDYDQPSICNAEENLALNNIDTGIKLYRSDLSKENVSNMDKYDIVFANIILSVNKDFITLNKGKFNKKAQLFLTGLLKEQSIEFEDFLKKSGFFVEKITTSGDWCLFEAKEI